MTLNIRSVSAPPEGRLRQLVLESLPQLLGSNAQALPSTGSFPVDTLTAVDDKQRLWVVSFSSADPGRALLDGLAALQEARTLLPWLRQANFVAGAVSDCALMILTSRMPAGAAEICRLGSIDWRQMRFLEVNGELGLWVEPGQLHAQAPAAPAPGTLKPMDRDTASELSPEEEAFFQHL